MVTDELYKEALAAAQTPMFTSKSSNIEVAPMMGVEFVDPEKYRAYIGAERGPGEDAAMVSVGPTAHTPQETVTIRTAVADAKTTTRKRNTSPQCQGDANPSCDPTHLCEVLGQMNNSLEHLEQGYFACFHETVQATREVLADLNEADATYVETILEAMRKWQGDVTLAITAMYTNDCTVWDANRNAMDDTKWEFRQACKTSHIKCAKARKARQKAIVEGGEKDPVIKLLDKVLEKTRVAANHAVDAFQKQFKEALVPCVPAMHLSVLVSNAYNTVSQFCMAIWRMVADECIMPMQHDYLTNFGLATIMQHALEKVSITCMRIVPPHPLEPKDDLSTLLDSLGNTPLPSTSTASMTAPAMVLPNIPTLPGALPTGSLGVGPASTATAPVFGGAPLTPVTAGMATGVSLFQTSTTPPPGFAPLPASVSLASTSLAPAAVSTLKGSSSATTLPISIPLLGHSSGRTDFLTNPIQASHLGDLDEEVDANLKRLAGSVTRKHTPGSKRTHKEDIDDDDEAEDSDGSMFEDLDNPMPAPPKRSGKAKSPAKSGLVCWLPEEVDIVHQNRYQKDRPEMIEYCQNYLSDVDQGKFNLKNHSKYLQIIMSKPSITQDVVFTKEKGRAYFAEKRKALTDLYDQGLLSPLPPVPGSKWFPDKEAVAIEYVMVIVACPNSQNIADDDPDGFGHTCLMGLWGLHTEKALVRCRKTCLDGVTIITAGFCPFCEFWMTNDCTLNNHIRKHYGMALACYHDGYMTGSVRVMKCHMATAHKIVMESAPKKHKRTR